MSSIAALPAPSFAGVQSGLTTLRKLLASDASPIAPIRPIPGRDPRRRPEEVEGSDDTLQGTRSRAVGESRGNRRSGDGDAAGAPKDGPVTATPARPTAGPNAGFVAQSLYQETVGSGLHIEPWPAAIEAYRRADAGPTGESLVRRIAV